MSAFLRALLIALLAGAGAAACASSGDDRPTARESYCNSAKLDFGRLIGMASSADESTRDQRSARGILAIFAANGDDWVEGSPPRLRSDSRVILRASRSAARGHHVASDDVALVGPLLRVRQFAMRCRG